MTNLALIISTKEASYEFARSYENIITIQGTALLCTAFYQSTRSQLSLFHAMVVLHLLTMLGVGLVPRVGPAGRGRVYAWFNTATMACASCTFIAFNVYVWITAPTFGSQPQCNDKVVYVLFGLSIPALSPVFRYVIIGVLTLVPGMYLVSLLFCAPCVLLAMCCCCPEDLDGQCCSCSKPEPGDVAINDSHINWKRLGSESVAYTAFYVFATVSLEQTISRNSVSSDEAKWTFSQILPLFLLLGPAVDFANAMVAAIDNFLRRDRPPSLVR